LAADCLLRSPQLDQNLVDQPAQILDLLPDRDLLNQRCLTQRPGAGEKAKRHHLLGRLRLLLIPVDPPQPPDQIVRVRVRPVGAVESLKQQAAMPGPPAASLNRE
jgi:hypothetical protein